MVLAFEVLSRERSTRGILRNMKCPQLSEVLVIDRTGSIGSSLHTYLLKILHVLAVVPDESTYFEAPSTNFFVV